MQTGRIQSYVYEVSAVSPSSPSSSISSREKASVESFRTGFSVENAMSKVRMYKSITTGSANRPFITKFFGCLLMTLAVLVGFGGERAFAQRAPFPSGFGPPARQQPHGQIDVHGLGGHANGAVELSGDGAQLTGTFQINNVGVGPLRVTRLVVRTSASDPRTPPGVKVELLPEDGTPPPQAPQQAVIPAGQNRKAVVTWNRSGVRAKQLFGHVLVESDSVATTSLEPGRAAAIGIHGGLPSSLGFVGAHVLSLLTFLPLVGLLAIFIAHLVGYTEDKSFEA